MRAILTIAIVALGLIVVSKALEDRRPSIVVGDGVPGDTEAVSDLIERIWGSGPV